MEISVTGQALTFLFSLVFGAALGAVYDVFRILRIAIPFGKIAIFIQDLLFFLLSALLTFAFMLYESSGMVRIFIIFGELLGATVYYFTLGVIVIKSSKAIIGFFKAVFSAIFCFIFKPIGRFIKFLAGKIHNLKNSAIILLKKRFKVFKFSLQQRRGVLYNQIKLNKAKKRAKKRLSKKKSSKRKGSHKNFNSTGANKTW